MIKIKKDKFDKHWYIHFSKNSFMHFINDWEQFSDGHWNWYSFHILHIYVENDIMCPGYEFEFAILGLGFRLRINRSWKGTEIEKRMRKSKKKKKK